MTEALEFLALGMGRILSRLMLQDTAQLAHDPALLPLAACRAQKDVED